MANYVGLDLGSAQARILEAEGSARKLKLVRFKKVDLKPPEEARGSYLLDKEAGSVIDKALGEGKFSREPAAMSWDSALTVFREMDLPFTGEEQIRKVIKYEAESHLLNCDIDDVVVSFYRMTTERDKSHLMVMAARKDQLLNRFEVLGRAGIDPLQVDLDVMAAFNALSALGYTGEHKAFMLLDCGRKNTNVLLVSGGRLVLGRAIRLGSDSISARLAGDLEADPKELAGRTPALLKQPGANEDDLVVPVASALSEEKEETAKAPAELAHDLALARADDFFNRVSREVRRTLSTTRLPENIEVIYTTGPGSVLPGFAEAVAAQLGVNVPLQPLKLLERVGHDLDEKAAAEAEPEILTALGLAFKLAGHDAGGVDFRQEECRYARKFDQVKEPLIYFCFFLMCLVLLQNLLDARDLWVKKPFFVREQKSDMYQLHRWAKEQQVKAVGRENAALPDSYAKPSLKSLNYIKMKLTARADELKGELGRGGAIPELNSVLPLWREAFEKVQAKMGGIGKLIIEDVTIALRKQREPYIELNGSVQTASALDDLKEALGEMQGIARVDPGKSTTFDDHVDFTGLRVVYPEREKF